MTRKQPPILIILLYLLVNFNLCSAAQVSTYTFAVVPQYPKLTIHKNWTPLIKYLSKQLGVKIVLKHYPSISEFDSDLKLGVPDFAYMNPYQAVEAKKSQGYIPLIRDGVKQLKGILVVRKDSTIKSVGDIKGQVVAFPDPNAFAASLYPRAILNDKLIEFKPQYVVTHANVYRHVILNKVNVGGGVYGTLNNEKPNIRNHLRIIFETPGSSPHPIGAHPRVPKEIQSKVIAAILKIADDQAKKKLLEAIQITKPVKANYEIDYRTLEALKLDSVLTAENK